MELKKGDKGDKVKEIQNLLIKKGFSVGKAGADGQFGTNTENAVKSFQKENKIPVNGIVDSKTLESLSTKTQTSTIQTSTSDGFGNVGLQWEPKEFFKYLESIDKPSWCKGITLHHTADPSLKIRPDGLTVQHIKNIRDFYKNDLKWKTGPHLFIDDRKISGMTPLTLCGTHAKSFNRTHIGIEVLGDYDSESPKDGRGLQCWTNVSIALNSLFNWLEIDINNFNFHRNDPKTSKTCPGNLISREWIIELINKSKQK